MATKPAVYGVMPGYYDHIETTFASAETQRGDHFEFEHYGDAHQDLAHPGCKTLILQLPYPLQRNQQK